MRKAIVALVAVTAAVIAVRQINRPTPVPGIPPYYGLN
jgi:hypothetical protein